MNAADILKYGHQNVLHSIDGLSDEAWLKPGVCGDWSCKDILVHLTSFDAVLVKIVKSILARKKQSFGYGDEFNRTETAARKDKSVKEILAEYKSLNEQIAKLIIKFPPEKLRETGTIPWYGKDYSLDDLIVYAYYGHVREHTAQIDHFKNQ